MPGKRHRMNPGPARLAAGSGPIHRPTAPGSPADRAANPPWGPGPQGRREARCAAPVDTRPPPAPARVAAFSGTPTWSSALAASPATSRSSQAASHSENSSSSPGVSDRSWVTPGLPFPAAASPSAQARPDLAGRVRRTASQDSPISSNGAYPPRSEGPRPGGTHPAAAPPPAQCQGLLVLDRHAAGRKRRSRRTLVQARRRAVRPQANLAHHSPISVAQNRRVNAPTLWSKTSRSQARNSSVEDP